MLSPKVPFDAPRQSAGFPLNNPRPAGMTMLANNELRALIDVSFVREPVPVMAIAIEG